MPPTTWGNSYRTDRDVDRRHAYGGGSVSGAAAPWPSPSTLPSPHSNGISTAGNGTTNDTVSRLESVIQQLQQQLQQQTQVIQQLQHGKGKESVANDQTGGGNVACPTGEAAPSTVGGHMSKSRYFGQSHWMNGLRFVSPSFSWCCSVCGRPIADNLSQFPLITGVVEKLHKNNDPSYIPVMVKCKNLAKSIKGTRVAAVFSFDIGKTMPTDESLARRLIEAYFRTFETVYRILHVPPFWEEYHKYWKDAAAASQAFIMQMQLCMAIGTCFQEDVVGLRHLAVQWIYEAQFWLAAPEKSRINFPALQVMCLLHLAREACGIGGDLTWISSGSLMRCAMYIGLHHDPDNLGNTSVLRGELKRRLWATILEIALQSSLDSGGPPLISPSDYDTKQPANFDDNQLLEIERSTILPRPNSCFTETSVQLMLLRSFPTRLAVAKYVNGFHASASYEQTSRLNAQLQQVSATLQHSYDPAGVLPKRMTLFQLRLAEHMVHRFFLALNQPCLGQARSNADYWFARKACVESSRKLCEGFSKPTLARELGSTGVVDDFVRLSIAGAGAFRSVPVQCMMAIGVELLWQALDGRSSRPPVDGDQDIGVGSAIGGGIGVAPRGELLEALQCCVDHQHRRISCAETNVKGYIFSSALLAQVKALARGASDAELEHAVLGSVRTTLQQCWELLKEVSGAKTTPPAPPELADNWAEISVGGQDMGDVFGFGGGWEWEDDTVLFLPVDHLPLVNVKQLRCGDHTDFGL